MIIFSNMNITIFTDGSSRGNPGNGGWGTVIISESGHEQGSASIKEIGGFEANTTNNRMEIRAAIEGLNKLDAAQNLENITIYTDSKYLLDGFTKWIKGWKRNGWKTKTKDDVSNRDLWEELDMVANGFNIIWKYIGGHVGILGNERCDVIATSFADGNPVALYSGSIQNYSIPNILNVSLDENANKKKSESNSRSKAKAYSYVSCVNNVVKVHKSWADCEARVKGVKGARYKKALNQAEEDFLRSDLQKVRPRNS